MPVSVSHRLDPHLKGPARRARSRGGRQRDSPGHPTYRRGRKTSAIRASSTAAHPEEVEAMINRNEAAAERAERVARERERFLAS